mgnify:CR=1 FL=1
MNCSNKIVLTSISLCLMITSCSDSLKSKFEDCYTAKTSPTELLHNKDIKDRIIKNYSQQYYDKLLSNANIYTQIYLDSLHGYYYMYGRKENVSNRDFNTNLRYYYKNDSLSVTMKMYNIEIDRSGYSDYEGWENDIENHLKEIEKQAKQGSAAALYILGRYHSLTQNNIVPFDLEKAKYYFQKSAEQHNTQSLFMLGIIDCSDGNVDKGLSLLEKAALQGNEEAQGNLGTMYLKGKRMTADYKKSVIWFSKLSERGGEIAQQALFNLGEIYINKIKDSKKALFYYQKSAELGYIKAQLRLALEYFDKNSYSSFVEPNEEQGVKWLRMAAKQGDPTAQNALAILLINRLVLPANPNDDIVTEGKKWEEIFENNPLQDNINENLLNKILFCFTN